MPALKSREPDWQPSDEDISLVIEMLRPLRREGDESPAEAEAACRNVIAAALRKIAEPPPLANYEVKEQLDDLVAGSAYQVEQADGRSVRQMWWRRRDRRKALRAVWRQGLLPCRVAHP
jgi:hypothetical protein